MPAAPATATLAALSETPALVSLLPLSMVGLTVGADKVAEAASEAVSVETVLVVPTLLLVMVADSTAKDELPVPVGI